MSNLYFVIQQMSLLWDDPMRAETLLRLYIDESYLYSFRIKDGTKYSLGEMLALQKDWYDRREHNKMVHNTDLLENFLSSEPISAGQVAYRRPMKNLDTIESRRDSDGQYQAKYGKWESSE